MSPAFRLIAALPLLLLPRVADAASRLVVHLGQPASVRVDGRTIPPNGGQVTVNNIAPGPHDIEFQGLNGELVGSARIQVPANGDVQVHWEPGSPLRVTGAAVAGPAPTAPSAEPPPPPSEVASKPPEEGDTTSFDENGEGSAKGQRAPARSQYAGNPQGLGTAVGTAARVGGSTLAPRATGLVGFAAPAVVGTTANMVRNAEAGGVGAISGPGPRAYQGRPIPPAAKTGTVVLVNPPGDPTIVYLEGFVVAQLGPERTKQTVTLEVGRHLLEFWDAETVQPIYKGVVLIDEGASVVVEFSDASAPKATERAWAWQPRSL